MTVILKYLFGIILGIQALIGLSFLISSIYEREKRASLFGGFQFLGMLILLVLFLILNSTDFFEQGIGYRIMIAGIAIGIITFIILFSRIGVNPKALLGTKGYITGYVNRFDERDVVFAKIYFTINSKLCFFHFSSVSLSGAGGTVFAGEYFTTASYWGGQASRQAEHFTHFS